MANETLDLLIFNYTKFLKGMGIFFSFTDEDKVAPRHWQYAQGHIAKNQECSSHASSGTSTSNPYCIILFPKSSYRPTFPSSGSLKKPTSARPTGETQHISTSVVLNRGWWFWSLSPKGTFCNVWKHWDCHRWRLEAGGHRQRPGMALNVV